ncbi:unnamed protein product, partial [Mycena citricolor]
GDCTLSSLFQLNDILFGSTQLFLHISQMTVLIGRGLEILAEFLTYDTLLIKFSSQLVDLGFSLKDRIFEILDLAIGTAEISQCLVESLVCFAKFAAELLSTFKHTFGFLGASCGEITFLFDC